MNKQIESKETKIKPELYTVLGVFYSIRYEEYSDSGIMEKLAKNEGEIIKLVKNDEYVGKGVTKVNVDLVDGKVYYEYKDWHNGIEKGILYLTKSEIAV